MLNSLIYIYVLLTIYKGIYITIIIYNRIKGNKCITAKKDGFCGGDDAGRRLEGWLRIVSTDNK